MGMKMYSKSVRFPEDLAAFVEQQPGEDFSKKLVGVLREYRDGNERRQADIRFYDAQIAQRRAKLRELTDKINSTSMIYRRVEALVNEVDAAEQECPQEPGSPAPDGKLFPVRPLTGKNFPSGAD